MPTDTATFRYTAQLADQIETRWQGWWEAQGTYWTPNPGDPKFDETQEKFYCLDMFPYPSGAGLHVGHPEGYTATDILCRFKRMQGCNVLHPMGWDAFGLPAEQYAIQTGVHPAETTRRAIDNFRRQLKRFGFSYDWSREFGTIDAEYYRWTQWIFLQLYNAWYDPDLQKARDVSELVAEFASGEREPRLNPAAAEYAGTGDVPGGTRLGDWAQIDDDTRRMVIDSYRLAYVSRQTVNWCPQLGTALANEEVTDGKSERGSYPVFRKPMRQWMFRITAYAERLLNDLDNVDWPESTKTMQAEWIGRSEGAEIDFGLLDGDMTPIGQSIRVFTTRPDTMFGATYLVVAPEHPLAELSVDEPQAGVDEDTLRAYIEESRNRSDVDRLGAKEKTGCFTGFYGMNPATGEPIPVWTADYVLAGYGTGAIMAVPGQDQRDWDFAKAFDLPIVRTVQPPEDFQGEAYTGDGPAINSQFLDGLFVSLAKTRMIEWLKEREFGQGRVNYRLRDWLFSRQRYWGEPFPIVWDARGNHYAVGEDALPVTLPPMTDYAPEVSEDPQPLLAKATDWTRTTAGDAGVEGIEPETPLTRETNTMPGWAGSCWYYLRYCDPNNTERFVSEEAERYWLRGPRARRDDDVGGVDLYIGGAEHAVLHLLYARFWHKVLFDLGHVSSLEPFKKLFHQGLITAHSYQVDAKEKSERKLVPVDEVVRVFPEHDAFEDGYGKPIDAPSAFPTFEARHEDSQGRRYFAYHTENDAEVAPVVAKMSKSLKNVVNPDDVIASYGADTFRLYEMYMGPLEASKPWNTDDIIGLFRFLQRTWRLAVDEGSGELRLRDEADAGVERQVHRTIAKVGPDIEKFAFNTAIASMIELVNAATSSDQGKGGLTRDQWHRFVRVLAPFAPHLGEELWHRLGGHEGPDGCSVAHASWPEFDESMLVDAEVEIVVQLMGKVKARITVPTDADASALEAIALKDKDVLKLIEGKTVRKIVAVPGRLINIVAN